MRARIATLAVVLGSCTAAPPPSIAPGQATELAGRVAGVPRRCVPIERNVSLRVAEGDRHTILYGNGRTVWVNRLAANCAGLSRSDILVIQPIGSRYCRGDLVRTLDPISRLPGPACILGDFVPYTR